MPEIIIGDEGIGDEGRALHSPQELGASLDRLTGHIQRANVWAEQHLERFPSLDGVSIQLGMDFGLMFSVTLMWKRKDVHSS